jgi:hypothetical protein
MHLAKAVRVMAAIAAVDLTAAIDDSVPLDGFALGWVRDEKQLLSVLVNDVELTGDA